jgi:CAAX protease family protein
VSPRGIESRDPHRLVRFALLFYACLAGAAWIWREAVEGVSPFFARPDASVAWVRDFALGAATAALGVALSAVAVRSTEVGRSLARALSEALGPLSIGQCVVLALASGVGEEAFFRGALQPRVGLLLASALFAAVHFVPRRDLLAWSAFSAVAGLVLGTLFDVTGNLVAPVVAHAGLNAVNLSRLTREADV